MLSNGWEYPSIRVNERFLKIIESPEVTRYKNGTILFSHVPAGGRSDFHTHPDNDEIMYFIGRGEVIFGNDKFKIETDSVLVAEKGVPHQCINTSQTETLKIFCVYIPALKLSGPLEEIADITKQYLKGKNNE